MNILKKNCANCYWMRGKSPDRKALIEVGCKKGWLGKTFKLKEKTNPPSWKKADTCDDFKNSVV